MSLITRCPACTTMFRVVPDQLRMSEGWVRCGQCDEVFDARANLLSESPSYQTAAPDASTEVHSVDVEEVLAATPEPPSSTDTFLYKSPHELSPFSGEAVADETDADAAHVLDEDPVSGVAPADESLRESDAELERRASPSFMRTRSRRSAWHSLGARFALTAMCVALGCALGIQVAVQERDRIAAMEPSVLPALRTLCGWVDCKISPLRQIDAVVIDSSAFSKVRADVYRLSFALKNPTAVDVATPAVELTLTDMQDQAVIRRVFTMAEYGEKKQVLASGAEVSASLPLQIKPQAYAERITGYRLLLFYP